MLENLLKKIDNEPDFNKVRDMSLEYGTDLAIIGKTSDIVFDPRTRLLCANGCKNYGIKHTCPPKLSDLDYERIFKYYKNCLWIVRAYDYFSEKDFEILRKKSSRDIHKIILQLEQHYFNKGFYYSTGFIGGSCKYCDECNIDRCNFPDKARIPVEALGIDLVKTLNKYGLEITFPVRDTMQFKRIGLFLSGR